MGLRNIFCVIGGILVLVATYFLTFDGVSPNYVYGLGLLLNLGLIFSSGEVLTIVIAIILVIFCLSGLFIILGVKSRFLSIFGSLLAILVSVYFILILMGVLPPEVAVYGLLFFHPALVEGIIPYHLALGTMGGLGIWVLLAGGILGLIGGIIKKNN
jgi:hypothetical protein